MIDNGVNCGKFTFASFNVNGASAYEKQKDVLDYLRRKKFDMVLLQETHWLTKSENTMRAIWGYNCFTCGNSQARKGVAILLNNTFLYKVHNIYRDEEEGSFLVLDISIFDERYTIANIYGPSERDSPMFFTQIFELIENINNRQVIAAGDWNVVLNPQVDAGNYRSYNPRPRSRKVILDNLDILNLVDVYRKVYPNKMAYSWRRYNTIQQSRLDYFIISDSLTIKITDVNIQPGYRSDHSIVTITRFHAFNGTTLNEPKPHGTSLNLTELGYSRQKNCFRPFISLS